MWRWDGMRSSWAWSPSRSWGSWSTSARGGRGWPAPACSWTRARWPRSPPGGRWPPRPHSEREGIGNRCMDWMTISLVRTVVEATWHSLRQKKLWLANLLKGLSDQSLVRENMTNQLRISSVLTHLVRDGLHPKSFGGKEVAGLGDLSAQ